MKCRTCGNEAESNQLHLGLCLFCTAAELNTLRSRHNRLCEQVKDLADTIDQSLGVQSDQPAISRLSSQLSALLQCYIEERVKNMTVTDEEIAPYLNSEIKLSAQDEAALARAKPALFAKLKSLKKL